MATKTRPPLSKTRLIVLFTPLTMALLALLALAAIGTISVVRRVRQEFAASAPPVYEVKVPPGFLAQPYAKSSSKLPTLLTFDPDGKLIIAAVDGTIFRYQDQDGDGKPETEEHIYPNPSNNLFHLAGIAFRDGLTYVSDSGRIGTLKDTNGDGVLDEYTVLVKGLPSLQFPDHSNNAIVFGPDGKLYVGVGATTDHGPLQDPLEASILRMNPDGSELEVFATGFRNPYDIVFSPAGDLFTSDNNPSEMNKALQYLPPEEIDHIRQGRDYGFPNFYGNPPPGMVFPLSEPPITELYASTGSAGITYYADGPFPKRYHNGLFLAQWGTGSNVALDRGISNGQWVIFVSLTPTLDGTFKGDWDLFANFNIGVNNFRPVDVAVGPDGNLYILEWHSSTVYQVSYVGGVDEIPPTALPPTPTYGPPPEYPAEQVAVGEQLFTLGTTTVAACQTCHSLDPQQRSLGPSLRGLYQYAGARVEGLDAEAYVRQSILEPNAYVVPGFNANYMFQDYAKYLSEDQIKGLMAYVLSLSVNP